MPRITHERFEVYLLAVMMGLHAVNAYSLPYMAKLLQGEFNVGDFELGIAMSIIMFLVAILNLLFGYLVDKFPRKKLLIATSLIWVVGTVLLGIANTFWVFILIGATTILGYGCSYPAIMSITSDLIPSEERGKVYALIMTISGIGSAMAAVPFVFIAPNLPRWRDIFYYIGIVFAIGLILLIAFIREPTRGKAEAELRAIKEYTYRITLRDLKEMMKIKTNQWLVIRVIIAGIPIGVSMSWLPSFIVAIFEQYSFTKIEATFIMGILGFIIGAIAMISPIFFGWLGDYYHKKGWMKGRIWVSVIGAILLVPVAISSYILGTYVVLEKPATEDLIEMSLSCVYQLLLWPNTLFTITMILNSFLGPAPAAQIQPVSMDVNLPENRGTISGIIQLASRLVVSVGPVIAAVVKGALINSFHLGEVEAYAYTLSLFTLIWIGAAVAWIMIGRYYEQDYREMHRILSIRAKSSNSVSQ